MAHDLIDLTIVGCEPVVSATELEWGVLGETDYSDGWSGARTTGWSPTRTHRVMWSMLSEGAARLLRIQLDSAQDNFGNVFVEVYGQEPIIGRVASSPVIVRHNATMWSAEISIEENR